MFIQATTVMPSITLVTLSGESWRFDRAPTRTVAPELPSRVPNHSREENFTDYGSDAGNLAPYSVRVVRIERISDCVLKSKTFGPLTAVNVIGFTLSAMLLGISISQRDGMSIVATALLSLLSSLIGLGNKWNLKLPSRKYQSKVPDGDVVIRYPKGSFLIVRCAETVARELYFAPESIEYQVTHGPAYRILSLVGTMMLMGGVICLANAQIQVQIAWAGAYMLLGASYWVVAALPAKMHWDTSCYRVTAECLSDSDMGAKGYPSAADTFTKALWKAIVVTKDTTWIRRSDACPDTWAWTQWLRAAKACSRDVRLSEPEKAGIKTWEIPEWDAQKALTALLAEQVERDAKNMSEEFDV